MYSRTLSPSERELAEEIIYLHEVKGLGFRRVARNLSLKGIKINKDRAFRLYHRFKGHQRVSAEKEVMDDELKSLSQKAKEKKQNVDLARAKEEKRRQIAALMVQEADVSFERRTELFENKMALLDFAEKVLPARNPAIWVQLTEFCELDKIALGDALKEALGNQAHFEEIREDYKKQNDNYLLDQHLRFRIEEWLLRRKSEEPEEEAEDLVDYELDIIIEDDEFAYIQIPLDNQELTS